MDTVSLEVEGTKLLERQPALASDNLIETYTNGNAAIKNGPRTLCTNNANAPICSSQIRSQACLQKEGKGSAMSGSTIHGLRAKAITSNASHTDRANASGDGCQAADFPSWYEH
eukprot:1098775-Pelagomonas_calceolata.AAC.3